MPALFTKNALQYTMSRSCCSVSSPTYVLHLSKF